MCLRSSSYKARSIMTDGSKSSTITSSRYAASCYNPSVTSIITLTNQPGDALLLLPWFTASHSLVKARWGKNRRGGTVSLCTVIWWNNHTRSKRQKARPTPEKSRT